MLTTHSDSRISARCRPLQDSSPPGEAHRAQLLTNRDAEQAKKWILAAAIR
jgi:hypothetical protein